MLSMQRKKVTLKSQTDQIIIKHRNFLDKIDKLTYQICQDFEKSINEWSEEKDLVIKTVNYEKEYQS